MEHKLWQQLAEWNESCEWVELSRELSLATPHHSAFPDMAMNILYNYDRGEDIEPQTPEAEKALAILIYQFN